jgi:hypothetical protein
MSAATQEDVGGAKGHGGKGGKGGKGLEGKGGKGRSGGKGRGGGEGRTGTMDVKALEVLPEQIIVRPELFQYVGDEGHVWSEAENMEFCEILLACLPADVDDAALKVAMDAALTAATS